MLRALLLGLILTPITPAFAVYKCESGGKVIYSDSACPGGKLLDIDKLSDEDAAAARQRAKQDRQTLERITAEQERARSREDKAQRRLARANAAQRKKCDSLARRQKWAEEDAAAATGKSSVRARRKAERAAETYQAECGSTNKRSLSMAGS